MPEPSVPRIPATDLARRLDQGERVQLLDIRTPERVARGRVTLGATLDFRTLPASAMYELPTLDSHMHSDNLSAARAAAKRWQVPYFLHPDDARSPYDGAEGRLAYQPLGDGDTIAFGRATLVAAHVPGHTLGSLALVADTALALTGDFLFVRSVGRPDLGGQRDAWAARLWDSLERVRRTWPGDLLILPAHYASETERRADRSVAARFDVIAATNEAAAIQDRRAFLKWVSDHTSAPPEAYRTIKLANLGLVEVPDAEAEILEFGPNACAIG